MASRHKHNSIFLNKFDDLKLIFGSSIAKNTCISVSPDTQSWYTYSNMCWVIARLSDGGLDGPQTKPGSTDGKSAVAWKPSGPRSTSGHWHLWVFCAAEWIVKRWLCRARLSVSATTVTEGVLSKPSRMQRGARLHFLPVSLGFGR